MDRLGFAPLGVRLSEAILSEASSDGLVIGVEGAWGSGKSSLTALTKQSLSNEPNYRRPEIVDFKPWLIGNRDALLAALFSDLRKAIDQIELRGGDATSVSVTAARKASAQMTAFAARLEPVGSLLTLGATAHPALLVVAGLVNAGAKAAQQASKGPSLSKLKADLDSALSDLKVKIVVVIDDVDRLEPGEALEILRLIRSVADFKNIVYILCYDPGVLSHAIEVGASVGSGRAFLEKIVQVAVPVPIPEPFLLRRWFDVSVQRLFPDLADEQSARLRRVIDAEGGRQLGTPRAVVRSLNAVSFAWAALRHQVDEADLVWLQLIRTGSPELYRWIEGYVGGMSVLRGPNVTVADEMQIADLKRLEALMLSDDRGMKSVLDEMGEHLLGINGHEEKIYRRVDAATWQTSIAGKRLSSPEHYRLFFAYELPPMALTAGDLDAFRSATSESSEAVSSMLAALARQADSTGLTKADTLLERFEAMPDLDLTGQQARTVLMAFADSMDDLSSDNPDESYHGIGVWRQVERILPRLLQVIDSDERTAVVAAMFGSGRAIGWLTAIFRTEYFAHGRYGSQRRAESEWTMTEPELDQARDALVPRYEALGLAGLQSTRRPASALFAWKQMGPDSYNTALEAAMKDDAQFLSAVLVLRSKVTSSAGDYYHISQDSLSGLSLSKEEALSRALRIAEADDSLRSQARSVIDLIEAGHW